MVFRRFQFGRGSQEKFARAHRTGAVVATWHFRNLELTLGELIEGGWAEGGAFLLKVVGCDDYFLDQVPLEVVRSLGFAGPAVFGDRVRLDSPGCREDEVISVIRYKVLAWRDVR